MHKGVYFQINELSTTAPDGDVWTDNVVGEDLDGLMTRSPMRRLEWRKKIVTGCMSEDWVPHDNTRLDSLTTRAYKKVDQYATYSDALCQSVTLDGKQSLGQSMVAVFLVNVESAS